LANVEVGEVGHRGSRVEGEKGSGRRESKYLISVSRWCCEFVDYNFLDYVC
jgi:hypothetical protein